MKIGTTLREFTENYNNIIKSKWRLMEEVDCLPNSREIKADLAKKILNAFNTARQELAREAKPLADALFLYTKELPNRIQILAGSPSETAFKLGEWQLIFSELQPEAVKEVRLTGSYAADATFKAALKSVAQTIMVNANADTIIEIWEKLPDSVKKEPENMVCPCCRRRGTCYVADYDDDGKYTIRCEECDYEGPKKIARYEAVDAYAEHFMSSYLRARKSERFDLLAKQQVDIITKALDTISKLRKNKACYCSPEANSAVKKAILDAVSAHFEEEKGTKK